MPSHGCSSSLIFVRDRNVTHSSDVQPEKAVLAISVTDSGIVILSSEVQPLNAFFSSISVTDLGIIVVLQPLIKSC